MSRRFSKLLTCLAIGLAGCVALPAGNMTPAEQHRLLTQNIDKMCKEVGAGPYESDPRRLVTKRGYTVCDDFLKLEPREWRPETFVTVEGQPDKVPPHWVATEEGRFAHSIKLPNPLPKDSGYRPGMSGEEYYKLLCEREAGEFIYRTEKDVEGILLMRPRPRLSDEANMHLYFIEDPAEDDAIADMGPMFYVAPTNFYYVEAVASTYSNSSQVERDGRAGRSRYVRYSYAGKFGASSVKYRLEGIDKASAKWGIVWRGLNREGSRELGIAGSETMVIDIATGRVLALQRFYSAVGQGTRKIHWETATRCTKQPNDIRAVKRFVLKVLEPRQFDDDSVPVKRVQSDG